MANESPEEDIQNQISSSDVALRRADDFKKTSMENFNISLTQRALDISIISNNQFGAARWAKDNIGMDDPGTPDVEIVEEQQLTVTPGLAEQFIRVMIESLIKKERIDELVEEEGEVEQARADEISQIQIDPDRMDEVIQTLKEEALQNIDEG